MRDCSFQSFDELSQAFPDLKRKRKLHPIAEKRLALLLQGIYPDAYPQSEPGEIPGGRSDLAFYFGSGRYAIFEVFATVGQVAQDLRHLEQSNAQARIAILTDPSLDNGAIFEEYFRKRPRDPFPWVRLSDILVVENEAATKEQLKQYIDEAFAFEQISQVACEDQVPDYELEGKEISSRICTGGVHIDYEFSMNSLTPWPGTLIEVGISDRRNQLEGLAEWELTGRSYRPNRGKCYLRLKLPYSIPHPKCDFAITIHAKIIGPVDLRQKEIWSNIVIPLFLLIEYDTPPWGYDRKQLSLSIQVNLGQEFNSVVASQEIKAT